MKLPFFLTFLSLVHITILQTVSVTHFDFGSYPDLDKVVSVERSQPKHTGLSNTIRYSLLLPDLICPIAKGRITNIRLIVPDGATGLDFQLQIWRRQSDERFKLVDTVTKTFSSSGTKELLDGDDFDDKYMQFNDILGIWLPWKYPVCVITGGRRNALFVARFIGPGSNLLVQNPPEVGTVEPITSNTTIPYSVGLEVTLQNPEVGLPVVLPIKSDVQQVIRAKRQAVGPTTLVYSVGVKGDKGAVGIPGAVGPEGLAANPGEPGLTGDAGQKGQKGAKGSAGQDGIGIRGQAGVKGPTGATGVKGPTGVMGLPGPIGATGVTGVIGSTGPVGLTGARGSQGELGAKGSVGVQGGQGPAGAPGVAGEKGERGEQGPMGPQGSNGQPGDSLTDQLLLKVPWCDANTCINAVCVNTLIGPKCECSPGYEFKTATECQDVDECQQRGICTHGCSNTAGGYTCTCNSGYQLSNDSRTCVLTNVHCTSSTCSSDETCHILTKNPECLANTIVISDDTNTPAQQVSAAEFQRTQWANDEWIIVFIIWGIILTIIVIITAVKLVYESRRSSSQTKQKNQKVSGY